VDCFRVDGLALGASYPPISVTVAVAPNATSPQNNVVTLTTPVTEISTANNTATDSTVILPPGVSEFAISKVHTGNFVQGGSGRYTVTVRRGLLLWRRRSILRPRSKPGASVVRLSSRFLAGVDSRDGASPRFRGNYGAIRVHESPSKLSIRLRSGSLGRAFQNGENLLVGEGGIDGEP